jgi:CheY-like chemotaxis protein
VQKVLIADDDLDDIELLKEAINECSADIAISYVTDGNQLMDTLLSTPLPDLLILDLNMPCKEGKECLSEIRANEHLKSLTIIVYSTSGTTSLQNECIALGANYFVTKPSQMSGIIKFVESIVKGSFDFV